MSPVTRCAFALLLCCCFASAQQDPLAWFPLKVGSRWVYDHVWKSGDRTRPDTDRWVTEETVTGSLEIPEGLVILRKVTQRSVSGLRVPGRVMLPNGRLGYVEQNNTHGYLVARDGDPYLVRGNCVYPVEGWDQQRRELRPEFRKYLVEGAVTPDFCFPLEAGQSWGNNDTPWRVESARDGATHIVSEHFGSGGLQDLWFRKGVGIVATHYLHRGTYDEYTKTLRSFKP